METPSLNPAEIRGLMWKNCSITGIICFIFGYVLAFIAMDQYVMNRPIVEYVREVTVIEQSYPMNIFDTKGRWISQGDPIPLTPAKEK